MPERINYVPISEANTSRIRAVVSLPFKLEEQIGLNTKRIHTLLQVAGLKTIKITTNASGKTSETSIHVVGLGTDGTALAGRGQTSMIPTHSDNLEDLEFGGTSKQQYWPSIHLVINNNEIKQRLLESNLIVKDPINWATEIDKAIKVAVRSLGTKHLLSITPQKFMDMAWGINILLNFRTLDPFNILFSEMCRLAHQSRVFTDLEKFNKGEGYRLSIFPAFEFDRAIILQILSRTKIVAKSIKDLE